jgi:LemA protein
MTAIFIILAGVALLVLWLIFAYNGLIASRNRTKEAWSDIEVQLKLRYDLIPNLVESVKGYIKQEKEVLENVTKARSEAIAAGGQATEGQTKAENALSGTLRSLFAVAESYPELKSSENFQQLSDQIADIEKKIMAARRFYNTNVRDFNTKQETIPTNIFAKSMGFTTQPFFDLEDADPAQQNVAVKF